MAVRSRLALIFLLAPLAGASCTSAPGDCPECPEAGLRDAASTCTPITMACRDGGPNEGQAERCYFDDSPNECFVKSGERRVGCSDCAHCGEAIRQLAYDVCTTHVDPCASTPCRNGGSCTEVADGFTCACPAGFTGPRCDADVNECLGDPCNPGLVCSNTFGSHVCACPPGFMGSDCGQDIDECALGTCRNGAACVNSPGAYACTCAPGFTGVNCDEDNRRCAGAPVACGTRTSTTCASVAGCAWGTGCSGTPRSCSNTSYYSCTTQPGCYQSASYYCSGTPHSCESRTTAYADCASDGCYETTSCRGTPTACSTFDRTICATQPGCYLTFP